MNRQLRSKKSYVRMLLNHFYGSFKVYQYCVHGVFFFGFLPVSCQLCHRNIPDFNHIFILFSLYRLYIYVYIKTYSIIPSTSQISMCPIRLLVISQHMALSGYGNSFPSSGYLPLDRSPRSQLKPVCSWPRCNLE